MAYEVRSGLDKYANLSAAEALTKLQELTAQGAGDPYLYDEHGDPMGRVELEEGTSTTQTEMTGMEAQGKLESVRAEQEVRHGGTRLRGLTTGIFISSVAGAIIMTLGKGSATFMLGAVVYALIAAAAIVYRLARGKALGEYEAGVARVLGSCGILLSVLWALLALIWQ